MEDGYIGKPIRPAVFANQVAEFLPAEDGQATQDPQAEPQPALSEAHLALIETMAAKLIRSFPEWIASCEEMTRKAQRQALCSSLHRLKGTAGSFGLKRISDQAAECEAILQSDARFEAVLSQLESLRLLLQDTYAARSSDSG